ncbi:hypothetical protein [Pontibacter sp. HSC-36F09]|uniref:hypothetical protein n=1 Tax=Pontibacter sp. HSC-36F09 TaxID=2910966 RepID=UPI00209FFFF7|nr:hypothetical protein [Pontibacter sp. HSC-36F09]MCP2045857.1 hypothetical protein [Pontibacter sp. HSC-36F09]
MRRILIQVLVQPTIVSLTIELNKVFSFQSAISFASYVDGDFFASSEKLEMLRIGAGQPKAVQEAVAEAVEAGVNYFEFVVGFVVVNPLVAVGRGRLGLGSCLQT